MKDIVRNWSISGLLTASVLALSACGGGGGGGDHGGGGGFSGGTFTRTFNATPTNFAQVFGSAGFGDMTVQWLHTPAEVGASGTIARLRFNNVSGTGSPTTCPNTTLRLAHTSLAALTTTFASNMNFGTPVVVLNNATVTIPAGAAGSWFEIPLTTQFDYDGVSNLVLQMDRTTACSATVSATNRGGVADRMVVSFVPDATPGTAENNTTTGALFAFTTWTQFVFEGGDNRLDFGATGVIGDSNSFPFTANKRTQHLMLASEVNGSGPVTGVAFQANFVATTAATYTYTLRLGHSTLGTLGTTFASNFAGSPTTVANAVTFTIPGGIPPGEWFQVPMPDGVFSYNGTDNLIVEMSVSAGTAGNQVRKFDTGTPGRRLYNNVDAAGATGTVDDNAYHIALRFQGGSIVKFTPSATAWNNDTWFNNLWSSATLYRATEIGTSGSITSISCRLLNPSVATSYANFRVIMGHATGSTLSGTAATDFVSQQTVFNGTFNVPGGLLAGDWFDIPLSTPFAYNGRSNLIVWAGNAGPGPGTGTITPCLAEQDATRYPGGVGITQAGAGSATYTPINWITDIRMMIQK